MPTTLCLQICTKQFLLPKIVFFLLYASSASIVPFLVAFYYEAGYSPQTLGVLMSITPFVSLLCTPLWTAAADKTGRPALLLNIAFTLSCLILSSIYWGVRQVEALFALLVLYAMTRCAVGPIFDSVTVSIVGRKSYGAQRVWGSISWGIFTFLTGFVVSRTRNYAMFVANAILSTFTLLSFLVLERQKLDTAAGEQAAPSSVADLAEQPGPQRRGVFLFLGDALRTLRSWQMLLLLSRSLASGAAHSVLGFLFPFLGDTFGVQDDLFGLYGLCFSVSIVLEVPVLMFQKPLVALVGEETLMLMSHAAIALRLYLYTLLPSAWLVLPVELLHGIFFGCFWGPGVSLAAGAAPPGLGATAQGMFSASFSGLGSGIGSIVGGIVYRRYGAIVLFQGSAFLMAILFIVTGAIAIVRGLRKRNKPQFSARVIEDGDISLTPQQVENVSLVDDK